VDWGIVVTGLVGLAGILGVSRNAAGQRAVELARIAADDRRRDDERREARRLARQEAYTRFIVALDVLDTYASGYLPSDDGFEAALHELNSAGNVLELVAPLEVREAMHGVSAVYGKISARMGHFAGLGPIDGPRLTIAQQHEGAYRERRHDILGAAEAVKDAMRADIQPAGGGSRNVASQARA
jgi:hypothetical protein